VLTAPGGVRRHGREPAECRWRARAITRSLQEYEALALKLATDSEMLAGIRARLNRNRESLPLFDTARFRAHIEAAYSTMWERTQRGEPPESFAVEPIQ
jgi:hypothetical protein